MDLQRVQDLLLAEQARLRRLLAELDAGRPREREEEETLDQLSSLDQHPAGQGTETFLRERDLSLRDQVEGELAGIERALGRLAGGTYGICEACGKPIGDERLEAEPATRFCIDDEAAIERELRAGY